jgi:hypothetical protein
MPSEKSTTPPVTPLASIAGKIKDAVAAQNGGTATTPAAETPMVPAAPPATPAPDPQAPDPSAVKNGPRHKLIQVLLEDQPEFRDKLVAAAAAAQLSPASWAKMVLAEKLGVTLPAPEKRASDPVQKAVLAADKRMLELVLFKTHYDRIAENEPIIKPMALKAQAALDAYVKKLAETVGQEKADAILKATEEKVAATRK